MDNRELNTKRPYGQSKDKKFAAFLIDVAELFDKFETESGNKVILVGEIRLGVDQECYNWNGEYFQLSKDE
jgi:hypothetical protein